jgi:pimeloyl-ACP methyl ester carboxylesterase
LTKIFKTLSGQDYELFYSVSGIGNHAVLMFHGFGQNHSIYDPYYKNAPSCCYYALDLFYHGKSTRPDTQLSSEDWLEIMQVFLNKEQIDDFSVIGFSLGGRFALFMALHFQLRIKHLILIAPDGFYRSPWYLMSTSWPTQLFFSFLVNHRTSFNTVMKLLKIIGFVNASMTKFIDRELSNDADLKRVYRSWTIHVFLGKKDPLIKAKKVIPFFNCMSCTLLSAKHHKLPQHPAVLAYLNDVLNNPSLKSP